MGGLPLSTWWIVAGWETLVLLYCWFCVERCACRGAALLPAFARRRRRRSTGGIRRGTAWSVFCILVTVGFGVWFAVRYGGQFGTEYFAGYIVEKSLSVDNLLVFVIIMTTTRPGQCARSSSR
ncbi:hypothetical protein ABT373_20645 [Streptomyces sp. NPDC000070]|uniref:hypothetical protein n=1 Tax=Streptomyces sp. NPDC000070 TaxID=3154240 RepID=UPI003331A163